MDLSTVLYGIGAILSAAGGTALVIREFRRRDHRASNREIDMLSKDLHSCRAEEMRCRRQVYELRRRLVDLGQNVDDE